MRYEISDKLFGDSFAVPRVCEDYLAEAGEVELRVLLFATSRVSFEDGELVAALSDFEESEVREALAFWRGAGLFSKKRGVKKAAKHEAEKPTETPEVKIVSSRPNYTSFDLANAVEQQPDFKSLVDYAEGRLEKMLNRADLSLLYSFVDYLALPVDVVMLGIEACVKEGKKSLRYIEKLLIALVDDGITSYEDADAYFVRRAEYLSYEGRVRTMCGFGSRALTAAEKKLITAWKDEYKYTEEELVAAYEKMIAAINKPSISYMNKVLHTLRETPAATDADATKTYDTESRFSRAVSRKKKTKTEEAE